MPELNRLEPLAGAGFLLEPAGHRRIFTRADLSEEQQMFYETAREFAEREVLPRNSEIEQMKPGVLPELVRRAGALGLLAVDIPEAYGGLELDKTTSALISEALTVQASFAVAVGVQTGIGTLPIVIFGTPEQKARYLPALVTGEKISAYCLSEAGSGSDAMAAKTTAQLDGDVYVLNGVKAWISNAGFADVFIVFAQVDGDRFSCFIVDGDSPGLSLGAEEKKMGLKGSSTRQVILDDVRVPASNLLGRVGRGHVIAFNILNIGRFKLGVAAQGGAKTALGHALSYARERRQFKTRLIDFPAIREKLARMACFIYSNESMAWRLAGSMDARIGQIGPQEDHWQRAVEVIKDYAIECSILKVYGSEGLSYCLDEALQIHGGYGFTQEYPIEQSLRDARVNRIFEGTNEINRMLIPGTLFKRVLKGSLNLMPAMAAVEAEVQTGQAADPPDAEPLDDDAGQLALERFMNEQAKKIFFFIAGAAAQKHAADLDRQQELLMRLADMMIESYRADSVLARVLQDLASDPERHRTQRAVARVVIAEAYQRIAAIGRDLTGYLARDPRKMIGGIDRLAPYVPVDLIRARRVVAQHLVEAGRYRL